MSDAVPELVKGASRVTDLFGQFDLHDAELRGVRLAVGRGNVPELEIEFLLPAGAALPSGAATRRDDYRVVLRCVDVSELSLADFEGVNIVTAFSIVAADPDEDGRPTVRVAFTCAPGCDLDFRCQEIAVVDIAPTS